MRRWLVVLLLFTAACTSSPSPSFTASVTQFRPDEGTSVLSYGITNTGTSPVHVVGAELSWRGLRGHVYRVDQTVSPGENAAFKLTFGEPRCSGSFGRPFLRLMLSSGSLLVPLHVDVPGLFTRLRRSACARLSLAAAAEVTWGPGRVTSRGYATTLRLRRVSGSAAVSVVDMQNSVLLQQVARLPLVLGRSESSTSTPLLVRATPRCDAHAQSQSQQTFLLSAFVRVAGDRSPQPVRVVWPVDETIRASLQQVIDEGCAH